MSVELIFIHIPKTAGISFLHTLNEVYGQENVKQIWELLPYPGDYTHQVDSPLYQNHAEFRNVVNAALRDVDYRVLFGHMPMWILEDLFPGVPRVTWLRNPLDQVLSRVFHFRKMRINDAQHINPWGLARQPLFRDCQFFYTGGALRQFAFVGIVERYAHDLTVMAHVLGWTNVMEPHHYHKTEYEEDVRASLKNNPQFCAEIKEINARDYMLYDWAANGN